MKSRFLALAVLVPVVAVSAGWSLFGKSEPSGPSGPSGPPTDDDVRGIVGDDRFSGNGCIEVTEVRNGGYVCFYRQYGNYYTLHLTWKNNGWQGAQPYRVP